jgi:hypothetical protein
MNGEIPAKAEKSKTNVFVQRIELYQKVESVTNIPWYYLAAIDQYERNVRQSRKDIPKTEGLSEIYFRQEEWSGFTNPNREDNN